MRHGPQQRLALFQCFGDKAKLEILEVAKPPVKHLSRGRRRRRSKVALLCQSHGKAPTNSVAGDPASIDATTDNKQINRFIDFFRLRHAILQCMNFEPERTYLTVFFNLFLSFLFVMMEK